MKHLKSLKKILPNICCCCLSYLFFLFIERKKMWFDVDENENFREEFKENTVHD